MNLFIDIETLPDQREDALERAMGTIKVPANYKKAEAIEKYRNEHAEEEFRKTALKGISGEICSIAWAIDAGEITGVCRDRETSEGWLIQRFFDCLIDYVNAGTGAYPRITWIAHNAEFDLRFLKQRALVNNIKPPFFIPADARHGGEQVFDTMKEWAGWRGYVKQDDLYLALGGQPYESEMDGSQVYDLWKARAYEEIQNYNIRDVEKLRHNYERLTWA